MLTIGSLFSGIGGLELGLERAGLGPVKWQVEQDEFCQRVLARHWPDAVRHGDVRDVSASNLEPVDLICGGFPCQDLSTANVRGRLGLAGPKSGLWEDFLRVTQEIEPRWAVVENSGNWRPWVPSVCRALEGLDYCPHPFAMDSADLGAPHSRRRVFVVAHAHGEGECPRSLDAEVARVREAARACGHWGEAPPGGWRVDDGAPHGVDRSRCIGNAVMPIMGELIGRVIVEAMRRAA